MVEHGNLGLAFGLVIAAGLSTALGASLVFCVKITNFKILAVALGGSAGVMTYVSIVEIFATKAITAFHDYGQSVDEAYRNATFCFFAGLLATYLLDWFAHWCMHCQKPHDDAESESSVGPVAQKDATIHPDPMTAPDASQTMPRDQACSSCDACKEEHVACDVEAGSQAGSQTSCQDGCHAHSSRDRASDPPELQTHHHHHHQQALARMGLMAALAVGAHNFPEGLATFVGALADPRAGVAIAIAIALHNIPEGIVVAFPIYYSTGSKWRGFLWSLCSGIAEPIGACIGYGVLHGSGMNPLAYAVLFGLVAGIMVYISIKELLPTALKYDPEDRYVTNSFMFGMAIMAGSLILFKIKV